MSHLSENLRFLRDKRALSQTQFSKEILVSRSAYAKYELGKSDPSPVTLLRIARYYHINLDILISHDLSKIDLDGLLTLEDNRILLPMKVDSSGKNFIEIIPHSAKAGYSTGYSDPEFIENLQHMSLPFLSAGKFRAFPIEGDSMPPHKEGSFIIGRLVDSFDQIKAGKTFVILTRTDGIVYKRIVEKKKTSIVVSSDNSFYKPYEIKKSEVLEIWQYEVSFATKEFEPDDLSAENVRWMFKDIVKGIVDIKENLKS